MKIIICPDSFKGSINAKEVANIIAEVIKEFLVDAELKEIPLADGGEGTAEIIKERMFPIKNPVIAKDPLGRDIQVFYYTDPTRQKSFIESAEIIGITLLKEEEKDPFVASSLGLGIVIKKAIESGIKDITVSLGGSATCDGGKGMMEILGELNLKDIKFTVVCDVDNPLLGENGAVKVYAPQKGAKPEDLPVLEKRMEEYVESLKIQGFCNDQDIQREGAGAAGGLGFAFQTLLKSKTLRGIDFILEAVGFEDEIIDSDLIITGEGKVDKQSLMGKVLSGVLKKAKPKNIPLITFAGVAEDKEELFKSGISQIYEMADKNLTLSENMNKEIAIKNLRGAVKEMLKSNIFKQICKEL